MIRSVLSAYEDRVRAGALAPDPAQAAAAAALGRLEGELNALSEPSLGLGFLRRREPPRGVYLTGPVGRGKSMLMDLFFASAPVARKRRVHFLAFMAEVHGLVNVWRTSDGVQRRQRFGQHKGEDPIAPVAGLIAGEARLLCFDEFQVRDIADAMILGRLFEALFARGVVVVATSNRVPDDLYKDGLNRQLFLPFIALLKARLEVVEVAGPKDFRADRLRGEAVYFAPLGPAARRGFDALWTRLLGAGEEAAAEIEVLGRRLVFPRTEGPCLRTPFAALCGAALGPSDYLAVAARFSTVFLEDVPILTADRRNEAARLVALIDALYEARALVAVLADAEPQALYADGDGAFEFHRTASRLEEMRSRTWVEAEGGRRSV